MPVTSPRVLIIRLDAIGDALALAPLLSSFAQRSIHTDIVLSERNADIFSSHAISQRWIKPDPAILRGHEYTHVLVATEDASGYRLASATAAAHRIGFYNGWGKPLKSLWLRTHLTQRIYRSAGLDPHTRHEAEVLFDLGRCLLGNDCNPTRDIGLLRPMILEESAEADTRIAFQVTDKWARLGIDFEQVTSLAKRCADAFDMHWLASVQERDYAEHFAGQIGANITYYDELALWKRAIACSKVLLAPDSGAIHVAGMTGVPTVAIFPPQTNFAAQITRWAPWAAPYSIVEATGVWSREAFTALEHRYNVISPT